MFSLLFLCEISGGIVCAHNIAQQFPVIAFDIIAILFHADTQLLTLLILPHKAAVQSILCQIVLQNLKLSGGENINILALSRPVKAALGFNDPYFSSNADDIVREKGLLFSEIIHIYNRERIDGNSWRSVGSIERETGGWNYK